MLDASLIDLRLVLRCVFGAAEEQRILELIERGRLGGTAKEIHDRFLDGWTVDVAGEWVAPRQVDPEQFRATIDHLPALLAAHRTSAKARPAPRPIPPGRRPCPIRRPLAPCEPRPSVKALRPALMTIAAAGSTR